MRDAGAAARERGLRIEVLNASSERDFDMVFATLVRQRVGTLLVSPSPMFMSRHE